MKMGQRTIDVTFYIKSNFLILRAFSVVLQETSSAEQGSSRDRHDEYRMERR